MGTLFPQVDLYAVVAKVFLEFFVSALFLCISIDDRNWIV